MESTDVLLRSLAYADLKQSFSEEDKNRVKDSHCVSSDEDAIWLVDYWCDKDIRGLIKMPFSRHWIMHVEAMCRIKDRLCREARKGVDPIARCGLNAIKAMALFIRKYGKKELLKIMDYLRKEYKFEKIQDVLGNDLEEGLKILEKSMKREL